MKYSRYRILEDCIVFDCYEFRFSSLRKNNMLTLDRIKEVDFTTIPCSMEIDMGELIFFNHNDTERIKAFTEKHQLPVAQKADVWELLCAPFLDTELTEAEIRHNTEKLVQLHFSISTVKQIRKKIKFTLLGTWEWQYLGHWDVLAAKQARSLVYRFNGKDFYWWTMELALQGKRTSSKME